MQILTANIGTELAIYPYHPLHVDNQPYPYTGQLLKLESDSQHRTSHPHQLSLEWGEVITTLVIVLGALQEALAAFSNPMEALKMVFGVRSIRVFSKFSLDPYYELLPWFMI